MGDESERVGGVVGRSGGFGGYADMIIGVLILLCISLRTPLDL